MTDVSQLKAAGYVRVSQVGGRSGDTFLSPDLQRDRISAWAAYRQYDVVAWYTDLDVSGRSGVRRPELERLMTDAETGLFTMVAVYRLTRFGRSVKDTAVLTDQLLRLGVDLVSVTEDLDTSTPGGRFMRNMLFAMAEFESERIGEEWSGVHRNRRSRGLGHASRGVYGYEVEGAVPTAPVDVEAAAVRGAYLLRADGATLYAVREWLHREGHRPRSGHAYFAASTVGRLLRSPIYAGLVETPQGLIDGTHEAIVPRDLWERVQTLSEPARRVSRHRSGLLAGIVYCASCGYRMQSFTSRGDRHYRCSGYKMSEPCRKPTMIAMPKLDEYVETQLLRRIDPGRMKRPRKSQAEASRVRRLGQLEKRSRDLARALDRLSDERYLLGSIEAAEYERQVERLVAERRQVEQEASDVKDAAARRPPTPSRFSAEAWEGLSLERRQRVVRAAIERVVVSPGQKGGARWITAASRVRIEWLS